MSGRQIQSGRNRGQSTECFAAYASSANSRFSFCEEQDEAAAALRFPLHAQLRLMSPYSFLKRESEGEKGWEGGKKSRRIRRHVNNMQISEEKRLERLTGRATQLGGRRNWATHRKIEQKVRFFRGLSCSFSLVPSVLGSVSSDR